MQNSFKTNYKIRNEMVYWNFIKSLKKQAKQWKTGKKTGKQENVQKARKNRKTGSVKLYKELNNPRIGLKTFKI